MRSTATTSWLSATQALLEWPVKAQTLYAAVSRGRVRARPDPRDPRRSQYHAQDVAACATVSSGRRTVKAVADRSVDWGEPVLESSLSTVIDGRLVYRGRDAVLWAEQADLEAVATCLWGADAKVRFEEVQFEGVRFERGRFASGPIAARRESGTFMDRALVALAPKVASGSALPGLSAEGRRRDSAALVATLVSAALGRAAAGAMTAKPLHHTIAAAWRRPAAADAIRRALVLLADHELNPSTFAARVAASTGASLAACLIAGLATLSGPRHGSAHVALGALLDDAERHGCRVAVRAVIAQGRALPTFGHPLYPRGDPRAMAMLTGLALPPAWRRLQKVSYELTGERPNVDFGLAALCQVHRLPAAAPLVLFALARSVGWLAHAMEQAGSDRTIRPRARYVGEAPAGRVSESARPATVWRGGSA